MDDAEGVRAFHESAPTVQMPTYEFNASMMSRLLPRGGTVLDLGSGSGQLAAHLATGRPDVTITCVDLSEEMLQTGRQMASERGLDERLTYVAGDITDLDDGLVGSPDLVCCNWTYAPASRSRHRVGGAARDRTDTGSARQRNLDLRLRPASSLRDNAGHLGHRRARR